MTEQGRLRPVLVNFYEKVTDQLLSTAAEEHGDRLLTKVRLADVVNLETITGAAKRYGLSAHLDFVMVHAETSVPRFAVEFDGASHWTDPAVRRRDQLKDELCQWANLPLLRITSAFTRRTSRWPVLTYVVDAFYLSTAFFEAQEAGLIPEDEPFIITSVLTRDQQGGLAFNALDHEARLALLRDFEAGKLPDYAPDLWLTVDPHNGAVQAHAFLAVAIDRYLVSRVRVRNFLFQGITPSEVASQLAVADLADMSQRWQDNEPVACDGRRLAKYMAEVQEAIDAGGFRGSVTGGALRAGGPLPRRITTRFRSLREGG